MKETPTLPPDKVKEKPKVTFRFPKDGDLKPPKNFGELKVDSEATVTVIGTVKSVSSDNYLQGDKDFSLQIESLTIEPEGESKATTIKDALGKAEEGRKT